MNARYLTDYIIIEEPLEVIDLSGSRQRQWQEVRKCYARVTPLFNKSCISSQHLMDKIVSTNNYYELILRCSKNISNRMRVLWKGRLFSILRHLECNQKRDFIKVIIIEQI